jgi:integrase
MGIVILTESRMTPASASNPAAAPCRRGHTQRNKFGQCVICLRASRTKYRTAPKAEPAPAAVLAVQSPRKAPAIPHSFLAVAREYLLSQDNVAERTSIKRAYLLEQLQAIHDRPIAELTTPDFVRALKDVESVGDRRETAHRAGMLAAQVTRYAVNHGYATINALPSGQLRGTLKPVKVDSHAAIIDPQQFGLLLKTIDLYADFAGSRSQPGVTAAMQLAPLVFARPGELRHMEWSEVNLDKAEWVIPAEKMKMRRPLVVPLSKQALAILRKQHEQSGTGRYVFRTKRADEPLSENGFREVLRTILGVPGLQGTEHTMHGFRSSASTLLNGELGIDSALIELQLAHVKGDRVAGIYDRSQRLPERRAMMQKWSDYLDQLKAGSK